MQRLAYEAHSAGCANQGLAELGRGRALEVLEAPEYLGKAGLAADFLDYVDQRAGLLVGRGGVLERPTVYTFPHRTFQEYLAGCYVFGGRVREAEERLRTAAGQGEAWGLAVEFGAEELVYNGKSESWKDALDIADKLLRSAAPAGEVEQRLGLWAGKIAAVVGAEQVESDNAPFLELTRRGLAGLLGSELRAVERADAGAALGRLGDPRPEVMTIEGLEVCYVPGGPFWMGEDEELHRVDLAAFWIGKHPVSQAQYDHFVRAGGYGDERWWGEARAAGYWDAQGFKGWVDDALRTAPERWGEPFDLPNHPVAGVSWYEALAFTRWLDAQARRWGWRAFLPSEAQWEKAGRGGERIPQRALARRLADGPAGAAPQLSPNPQAQREWPWGGGAFDRERANVTETGVGAMSALGCFPGGAGPYGALDLAGNVWEWTSSENRDYPYNAQDGREDLSSDVDRVLRGGAFGNGSRLARCAFRLRLLPDSSGGYFGFRVAFLPAPVGADSGLRIGFFATARGRKGEPRVGQSMLEGRGVRKAIFFVVSPFG